MRDLKAILKAHGKEDVEIICKIENMEGVNNIQEILDEANGVMVCLLYTSLRQARSI